MQAKGSFDVKLTPQAATPPESAVGRMTIDKHFHGALEAHSRGEMLMGGNPAKGSAGYVAIEEVIGTLDGKPGVFLLQHSGAMHAGHSSLTVTVIPGTGSGELEGISGTMAIQIEEGKHGYSFDYTLPQ